jgi:hypothetical protein
MYPDITEKFYFINLEHFDYFLTFLTIKSFNLEQKNSYWELRISGLT